MIRWLHLLGQLSCGLILCLLPLTVPGADADTPVPARLDMATLYEQVHAFLKQNIGQTLRNPTIHIRRFGRRMQLPACSEPITLQLIGRQGGPLGAGRVSVLARCPAPFWKVFISATIEGELPTVVATRVIPRKTPITAEAVTLRWMPAQRRPRNAAESLDAVIGLQARRNISEGEIITAQMLLPPYWVFRQKPVTLLTRIGRIEVRTRGIAQKDGVQNEVIPVKNARSGKIVRGIVIAPNTVLVP